MKLSVAIITFNEEMNIGRCIESVREIADEIIVVDSYSKDQTKEIAVSLHATFIEHPFEGHIQQKNFALSQCRFDYVLSLDADEAPSAELLHSIKSEKEKGFTSHAYSFNRLSSYGGKWIKHGSWYPDTKLRLIKRGTATWGGENPHDKLIPHQHIAVRHLNGDLLHYTAFSKQQFLEKSESYSMIGANEAFKRGKKSGYPFIWLKAGFRFFRDYIIKLGILDGAVGLEIALISARANFRKYRELRRLSKKSVQIVDTSN